MKKLITKYYCDVCHEELQGAKEKSNILSIGGIDICPRCVERAVAEKYPNLFKFSAIEEVSCSNVNNFSSRDSKGVAVIQVDTSKGVMRDHW